MIPFHLVEFNHKQMNTPFLDIKIVRKLFFSMTALLAVIAVVEMGLSLFRVDINADAAYYLGASRLILEGKIPFLDFPPEYTPLSFYMMAVPTALFGASYTIALLCLYMLHIANACIVYKIVRQYYDDKLMAAFCSAFSLLLCLGAGRNYILEPFVLFFGLLALLLLKKGNVKRIILSGFLCFCSFWCKQYGLGSLCLAIVLIVIEEDYKRSFIRKSLYLLMGFFIAMTIFVLFFLAHGVDPLAMVGLSGSDYRRAGLSGLLGGWESLLITLPLLAVAIIVMFVRLKDARKESLLIVSFFAVFGFMLQCYVRFYSHYMILAMPFCVLLLFACMSVFRSIKWKNIYTLLLLLSPVIPMYFATKSTVALMDDNPREKQIICAKSISQYVPNRSENVYCAMDLLPVMFLNTYNPPLISKYGMSNGFVEDSEGTIELIHAAEYCMISEKDLKKTRRYTADICDYLNKNFDRTQIEGVSPQNSFYIYIRKK